jgi:hypothetical protein
MTSRRRERGNLWLLVLAPTLWALHFLVSYVTAAVYCAKTADTAFLLPVRIAVVVYTLVALAGIGAVGLGGYRRHFHTGEGHLPHDRDVVADQLGLIGFSTLLLAGLSAVATVYTALPAVFIESCR